MASICKDPNGRKRILFVNGEGDRKSIRLGKMSLADAREVNAKVESILSATLAGRSLDNPTAKWVADMPNTLAGKLAAVGLISKRDARKAATLDEFIESYVSRRMDVSPHTRRIWRQTKRNLVDYFGANKPLAEITKGAAADWRLSLVAKELADATVRKHCGFAKHFFAQAVDHELIESNPFSKLVSSPVGNESRQRFISRDDISKVLDAAPDAEWRLIIALSRYGGLRCPSEHLALTWDDVDWAENRLHITSPKTARHAGHESRVMPLFPELRPYLDAVFHSAEPGKYVVTRYRNLAGNIRTQMTRIVKRAGLMPWPRIFHNLRASRQTELEETFPTHVVCRWIGNSPQVARKHYLQVTEEHFDQAIQGGAKSGALVAQNQAQQAHAGSRREPQKGRSERAQSPEKAGRERESLGKSHNLRDSKAEVHGNRTSDENTGKTAVVAESGAESGALCPGFPEMDAGLATVIDAWPSLPNDVRTTIVTLVRGAVD